MKLNSIGKNKNCAKANENMKEMRVPTYPQVMIDVECVLGSFIADVEMEFTIHIDTINLSHINYGTT